ncbi:MAG: calcium/sodium antiporter [Gammaproteobacteria bacterium]
MLSACLTLIGGLVLLIFGADRFIAGAARTARGLGVSPLIIGMTVVGIATSMPEILVGSVAAFQGKTIIAIGNAIGSNIANIGLILGVTAVFTPFTITSRTLRREFLLMCGAILIALLLMLDLNLSRFDGLILITSLIGISCWVILLAKKSPKTDPLASEFEQQIEQVTSVGSSVLLLFAGLLLLLAGSELFVRGAVIIAQALGVSDLVIGLTIVAVGTSLPELAASMMSVVKNEPDIAIGNIIGSNMFNMLMVLGIPCLIQPSGFGLVVMARDFLVMIMLTILLGVMIFIHGRGRFDRLEGGVLLSCFIGYQILLFKAASG